MDGDLALVVDFVEFVGEGGDPGERSAGRGVKLVVGAGDVVNSG